MSEHQPEETMAIVASGLDPDALSDELIDERSPARVRRRRSPARTGCFSG
jgi:hypothetical protein